MANIQIIVDNGSGYKQVDLPSDNSAKFTLYKSVQDFRDPLKATGAVSLPFTLPATNKNRTIFLHDDDKQKVGKFKGSYQAKIILDNETLLDGELTVSKLKANQQGFEVYIGQTTLANPRLGDIVGDKKLTELLSFQPLAFSGNTSVLDSWNTYASYPAAEVCFPHVLRSFSDITAINGGTGIHTGYESLGISHFCAATVAAIFQDAGYQVTGDVFNNEDFLKLTLLYSNSGTQYWNYGTLAPMKADCLPLPYSAGVFSSQVANTYERQNDMVQVLTYGWQAYDGDLCESLGSDGVYTCKYSGLYSFRVSATHTYANGASGNGGFTAFRCISDNEFMPDSNLPSASAFSTVPALSSLDVNTLAVGGSSPFTFTVRLTEGKQYQVQRYVQFTSPKSAGSNSFLCYSPNEGNFYISACDGPLTVNPALFLPDMTQQVYLKGIFKLFNLYYQVNESGKTITLFSRDDFFQESLQDIVNLSAYLSVEALEETAFTQAEIAANYVQWKADDTDYLLQDTDYLTRVNGVIPSGATALPFAPIGFLQVDYTDSNGDVGSDLLPAIIPATDVLDTSILSDDTLSSQPGSWQPRLLLYHENTYLNATNATQGQVRVGRDKLAAFPPKLSFFNVQNQPAYEITINQALRSFSLSVYTGSTIYTPPASATFLADTSQVDNLDTLSLATNLDTTANPKGFFFQLYGNDLLIGDLSNYLTGAGRMNSVLWNKLTGRQVLRVNQDLYLLDSITNFDVAAKLATYKLYKLVSHLPTPASGTTTTPTGQLVYTSTMTATADCPTNTTGNSKQATATRSSYTSQAEADQKAYQAALQLATSQLVCATTSWVGVATAGAVCAAGSYGYEVMASGSYVSSVSQADADQQAYQIASANAQGKLVCYIAQPVTNIQASNVIYSIQGDYKAYSSYADALAYQFTDYTYLYAFNQTILVGYPVYVLGDPHFYPLSDGYYPFRYTIGNDLAPQGFHIVNGVVADYIDNINLGATG